MRDYKVASGGSDRLNTSSPFNIKVASLTMRNFNLAEVGELYQQHTAATGQIFTPEAIETAYDLTQGQPWLVNALAKEIVEKMVKNRIIAITKEHIAFLIHKRYIRDPEQLNQQRFKCAAQMREPLYLNS